MYKNYKEFYESLMSDFEKVLVNNYSDEYNPKMSKVFYSYCDVYFNYSEKSLKLGSQKNVSSSKFKEGMIELFKKYDLNRDEILEEDVTDEGIEYFNKCLNILLDIAKVWNDNREFEDELLGSKMYSEIIF